MSSANEHSLQRLTKSPRYSRGSTAQYTSSSRCPIGLPDGGHVVLLVPLEQSFKSAAQVDRADQSSAKVSLPEKEVVRRTLKMKCRTTSLSLEDHQQYFGCSGEGAAKSLGAKRICRKHGINRLSTVKCIRKQHGIRRRPFQQSASSSHWLRDLPDGGHIISLSEKKFVRKAFKGRRRTMSVLSLEDRQQHFGSRWDHAAKSLGAKHICSQHVISRVSIVKRIRRQHPMHRWPFRQSASSSHWLRDLPDGGHIVSLSEKKFVRKAFKGRRRTMSVLSLEDRQQHFGSRWDHAAKSLGANHICSQHVINRVSIVKRIRRQHPMHRWPFQQICVMMKGSSLVEERSVEVVSLSVDGKLVKRVRLIHISWLGRSSPRHLALPEGEILGPIALSSSGFAATNNRAHIGQNQVGSAAPHSEKKRRREIEKSKGKTPSISLEDLRQHFGSNREEAADRLGVSVSTLKRICRQHGIERWLNHKRHRVWRPPDPHGERNPSPTFMTLSSNGQSTMWNEMGGQNPEPNEFLPDSSGDPTFWNTQNGLMADIVNHTTFPDFPPGNFFDMGSSEDWRILSASQAQPILEGHVSGSSNLVVPTSSDPAPSQPVATIPHVMPSISHMMPPPTAGQDMISVILKATYRDKMLDWDKILRFPLPLTSGIMELKQEVAKRLELQPHSFYIAYKDEEGDLILINCDEDLQRHLLSSSDKPIIRLSVVDSGL